MASFVVMQGPAGSREDARIRFIRDGFAWWGFLLPVIWLAWHRLWIEALAALAVTLALGGVGELQGFGWAAPLLTVLVSLYVGLDGAALRIAALRRRGVDERGVIDADDRDAAETRFFLGGQGDVEQTPAPLQPPVLLQPAMSARPSGPALGLLQYPGR